MTNRKLAPMGGSVQEASLLDGIIEATIEQGIPAPAPPVRKQPAPVAPAASPAPRPKPAPVVARTLSGTWAKLPDGSWGIRVNGHANPGDKVTVYRRDGAKATITLGAVVSRRGGETIARKLGSHARPARKRRRVCRGNNNCRRLGWAKGPNCSPGY